MFQQLRLNRRNIRRCSKKSMTRLRFSIIGEGFKRSLRFPLRWWGRAHLRNMEDAWRIRFRKRLQNVVHAWCPALLTVWIALRRSARLQRRIIRIQQSLCSAQAWMWFILLRIGISMSKSSRAARWFPSFCRARRRCLPTFPCATASSAGFRAACLW